MINRIREGVYTVAWKILSHLGLSKVNYYTHYHKPDLDDRFEILAGCNSAEEFHRSGQETLRILASLGLRPYSKILDF